MNLNELIPEQASMDVTIPAESGVETLKITLRPFDLEDESWLKSAFGDELKEKLEKLDMDVVSRMAFHQLEIEVKRKLMKIKFLDMNEDTGEEVEIAKTGPKKLRKIIIGVPQQLELVEALLKTRGFSMPILEELSGHIKTGDNSEKKTTAKKAGKKTSSKK